MNKNKNIEKVRDYNQFLGDLRVQLEAVNSFARIFFECDELCEVLIDKRIAYDNNLLDELSEQQLKAYNLFKGVVHHLGLMLAAGEDCFTVKK